MIPNRVVLQCSACESKLYLRARFPTREWWVWQIVWQVIFWACVWRLIPSFLPAMLLGVPFAIVWAEAEWRLRYALWTWRHPTRCGDGGHFEPLPEAS